MAHHGVLFLDEAPEFARGVLDSLRQPLESGRLVLDRSRGTVDYPARFQLVLAANPCPCGLATSSTECRCPPASQRRYVSRLSGPLVDRIDLMVHVPQPTRADLLDPGRSEGSATVAERVVEARARAARRWAGSAWDCNARVPGSALRVHDRLTERWALRNPFQGDTLRGGEPKNFVGFTSGRDLCPRSPGPLPREERG